MNPKCQSCRWGYTLRSLRSAAECGEDLKSKKIGALVRPSGLEMPGRAHLSRKEFQIRFVITQEAFLVRVPNDFAIEAHGDLAEVTERVGSYGLVDVADRVGPVFNAVYKIVHVVGAS